MLSPKYLIVGPFWPKFAQIFFWKISLSPHLKVYGLPLSCRKSEKIDDTISRKVQKTSFWALFWPKFAQKNFFSKIGLRHI